MIKDAMKPFIRSGPSTPFYQQGKIGYILAWLIGVPAPILVLVYLLRGCT